MTFSRISVSPAKMAGVPCIRDLRMPVATVVGMVADGMTVEEGPAEVAICLGLFAETVSP